RLISAKKFILLIDDNNNYEREEITDEEIVNMVKSNEIDLEEEELVL
ncbi:9622_t:CDS:1, partial [Rhizophagus irregularis]